ncbi:virginiamycin B lyase family protein [Streptomyces sp. NPDC054933]
MTTIPAGTSPFAVAVAPNGRVFVANASSNNVTVIDSATDTALTTLPVGSYPIAVAVAPNGNVYVANNGSNNVTVIDSTTNTVLTTLSAGTSPQAVAVAANGRVYIANNGSNNVTVVDSTTDTVLTTLPAGTSPYAVAVAPNGRVYVANAMSNDVTVIDSATDTVLTTLPAGTSPYAVAVAPNGRVYIPNNQSNNVTVIDSTTDTVLTTLPAGTSPYAVAVAANGRVYIPNNQSNNVTVIDSTTDTLLATVAVGSGPEAVAVASDGKVYVTSAPNGCPDQVYFATNDGGVFRVAYRPFNFPDSQQAVTAGNVTLNINAVGYADSGVVLESFKLGDIDQVTVGGTGPLTVNLWFDTNNDGRYFTGLTPTGTFQGVGSDDYGNLQGTNVEFFTDSHGTVSLAALKAGAVPGINANTTVALWVGIAQNASASITTVNGQNVVDCIHGVGAGNVTVIDSTTNTVLTTLTADSGTWAVAVAPNGKIYAANSASSDVSVYPAYPTLTAISPTQGPAAGGTVVTITGTNLTGASVTIGGSPATNVSVNPGGTQITATTPPGTPGPADVTVTTGGGTATLPAAFTYTTDTTQLTATPALAKLFPTHVYYPFLYATLADLATGLPVPGQTITFSTGGHFLGTATTDAHGTAHLNEALTFPMILFNGGYDATFAGTPTLQPATAHGEILTP